MAEGEGIAQPEDEVMEELWKVRGAVFVCQTDGEEMGFAVDACEPIGDGRVGAFFEDGGNCVHWACWCPLVVQGARMVVARVATSRGLTRMSSGCWRMAAAACFISG